jgi:hypothetical protein
MGVFIMDRLYVCPRIVVMAQGGLYWPEAIFEVIKHTF